jgi:hypothetical protein
MASALIRDRRGDGWVVGKINLHSRAFEIRPATQANPA